jgi:hypothetical protein
MQREGWKQRALGATLALLVQTLFLSMVLLSPSRSARPLVNLAHETILLLHSLPRTAPAIIDARAPASPRPSNALPIIIPVQPSSTVPSLAPPSGLAGFGQALFNCAPEHYADLLPDERAHCPKQGEGMTRNEDKDLGTEPRSHAKYEDRWQEQWTEDHWVPAPCLPGSGSVAQCLLDQSIAENGRTRAAWNKIEDDEAAMRKPSAPLLPFPRRAGQANGMDIQGRGPGGER